MKIIALVLLIGIGRMGYARTELASGATGYFGGEEVHCSEGTSRFAKAYYECNLYGNYIQFNFRLISEDGIQAPASVWGTSMNLCETMADVLSKNRDMIRQFTEVKICEAVLAVSGGPSRIALNTYAFSTNGRINYGRSQTYPDMDSCVAAANAFNMKK
jgi:hypothetical protein